MPNVWFLVGGPLKPSLLSRMIAEMSYVKHLAKHILIENALIPIFVLGAEFQILQLCVYSGALGTSFELLTATIGPRASLLRFSDLSIESALRG